MRTRRASSERRECGRSIIAVYDFSPHVSRRGCGRRRIGVGAEIGEWLLGQRGAGSPARSPFLACPVSLTRTICSPRHSCQRGGPGGARRRVQVGARYTGALRRPRQTRGQHRQDEGRARKERHRDPAACQNAQVCRPSPSCSSRRAPSASAPPRSARRRCSSPKGSSRSS